MFVLREETIVLDGMAQALDLVSQIIRLLIHKLHSGGNLCVLLLVELELGRARVHIPVNHLPQTQIPLQVLVGNRFKIDIFGANDES